MLKKDFTDLEARTLDLLLVLQAEHGGGNNSTFTVRVTSSTRTDTYSSIAAGIGSLKGPLHGGANIQVVDMFHHLKENIAIIVALYAMGVIWGLLANALGIVF